MTSSIGHFEQLSTHPKKRRSNTLPSIWSPTAFQATTKPRALRDYLARKYAGQKLDAVIAMSEVSMDFVLDHRKQLFPETPIVFYTGSRPALREEGPRLGLTGVVGSGSRYRGHASRRTHSFIPQRRKCSSYSEPEPGHCKAEAVTRSFNRFATAAQRISRARVSLTYLIDLPLGDLIAKVKRLPEVPLSSTCGIHRMDLGEVLSPDECLATDRSSRRVFQSMASSGLRWCTEL